jgi:hypothetical protein
MKETCEPAQSNPPHGRTATAPPVKPGNGTAYRFRSATRYSRIGSICRSSKPACKGKWMSVFCGKAACAAFVAVLAAVASGSQPAPAAETARSALGAGPALGTSVALRGTALLAGMPNPWASSGGAALLFSRRGNGWLRQTLLPPAPAIGFGTLVALGDGLALVSDSDGLVHTFASSGGGTSEIDAFDARAQSIAVSGSDLAVAQGGPASIYSREADGWTLGATLSLAPEQMVYVALDGERLAVTTVRVVKVGWFYHNLDIYVRVSASEWARESIFFLSAPEAPNPPTSVAMSGERVVVGQNLVSSDAGSATAFMLAESGWEIDASLDVGPSCTGRVAVSLDGSRVAVGCPSEAIDGIEDRGAVHVLERIAGTWSRVADLVDAAGVAGDEFGSAVALDGDTLAVGAPGARVGAGRVLVFEASDGAWSQTASLEGPLVDPIFANGFEG